MKEELSGNVIDIKIISDRILVVVMVHGKQ